MASQPGKVRIGELARRTGTSPAVLRAWEQRYGVIGPERSAGGTRLYSERDEARIRAMQAHIAAGLPPAEAARAALADDLVGSTAAARSLRSPAGSPLEDGARALRRALARLDREQAERALDLLLGSLTFETVAVEVLLPYLGDVGARWERGEASIAEEHLATQLLRARVLALTHGVIPTRGAQAVLACPPGEHHDIALVMLSVALERRGWRVTLLGADTPVTTMVHAADLIDADCVVVAAMASVRIDAVAQELRALATTRRLLLAGPGATPGGAESTGAPLLDGDPVTAAATLDAEVPGRRDPRWR
jgi:DNA-binding transcriptional MerR regulator/methylmalonyl-CoA mutase cobalamin-binding subunit